VIPRTAVVAGATGLVGSHCIRLLAASPEYTRVIALVRRNASLRFPKVQERLVDFERLDGLQIDAGADVFCALGTTIRKAGSKAAFRRVDFDYPLALARRTAELGARRFLVVSSVSADPGSSNFYLKTKGEMERELASLPFEALHIFRPSFLIGERQESRPGEKAGIVLAGLIAFTLVGPLRKYRAVSAEVVAAAMVRCALSDTKGVHIHHFDEFHRG
jgi:uncharacterized protein YbjT (DUF2867 family)